jgi:hypothetical protein
MPKSKPDRDDRQRGQPGDVTGDTPFGASAGSVTGVGGTFAAEAAALGVDSAPLAAVPPPGDKGDLGAPATPPAASLRPSRDVGGGPAGTARPGGSGRA